MSGHIRASLCFSTWMIPNDILIVKNGQCSGANLASKSSNIPKTKSSPGSCVRVEVPRILQSTPVNGPCFRSEAGPSVSSLHFLGVGSPIAPSMPSSMTGREILPTSVFFSFYPTHTVYEGDVCFALSLSHISFFSQLRLPGRFITARISQFISLCLSPVTFQQGN